MFKLQQVLRDRARARLRDRMTESLEGVTVYRPGVGDVTPLLRAAAARDLPAQNAPSTTTKQ